MESRAVHTFVIAESTKTNSLGRAISLALTAQELGEVSLLAYDDGPIWPPSVQFGVQVHPFKKRDMARITEHIASEAADKQVVVWVSKCFAPLPRLISRIVNSSAAIVVADFDDHDIALMEAFRSNFRNRLRMPPIRRKHPHRIRAAQRKLVRLAHGVTYSSHALRSSYQEILGSTGKPAAVIPHTRIDPARTLKQGRKAIAHAGFLGTIRPHKGESDLLLLLSRNPTLTLVTFAQKWTPPADLADRVTMVSPTSNLQDLYESIDIVLLPTHISTQEGRFQLPAKIVDAAAYGAVIAATPTPPILEFLKDAFLPVSDWSQFEPSTLTAERQDRLRAAARRRFEEFLSTAATAKPLTELISVIGKRP